MAAGAQLEPQHRGSGALLSAEKDSSVSRHTACFSSMLSCRACCTWQGSRDPMKLEMSMSDSLKGRCEAAALMGGALKGDVESLHAPCALHSRAQLAPAGAQVCCWPSPITPAMGPRGQ